MVFWAMTGNQGNTHDARQQSIMLMLYCYPVISILRLIVGKINVGHQPSVKARVQPVFTIYGKSMVTDEVEDAIHMRDADYKSNFRLYAGWNIPAILVGPVVNGQKFNLLVIINYI